MPLNPKNITQTESNPPTRETQGVKTLLGDPKKAMIRLSLPMIAAMSVQTLYNLVDSIWVSGLGSESLAAIGFVFPFFFMVMALAGGLGVGAGSAISRRIGARDKPGADNVAAHSILLMFILVILTTLPLLLFAEKIFTLIGAAKAVAPAVAYGRIIFGGSILIFFNNLANSILRSEGDAKRAMRAMVIGAGLNIVLDPLMIYGLKMGISGAAWATLISLAVSCLILLNWLIWKKITYVSFRFRGFRFSKNILRDILGVGLPASLSHLSMSITMLIVTAIIVRVGSTDGVAVYTAGWRIVSFATLPLVGIATAVVSVSGAAFGARAYDKVDISHVFAVKMGLIIEGAVALLVMLGAPLFAALFTHSAGTSHLGPDLVRFLRITAFFYPTVALGMFSSAMFQGVGKGINALMVTFLRTVLLTTLLTAGLGIWLDFGLPGIWWGLVGANMSGSVIAFIWARSYVAGLRSPGKKMPETAFFAPSEE